LRVRWSTEAKRDRREIISHIWADNAPAAKRMNALFVAVAERLKTFPELGRPGVFPDTREVIPHPNYRLVYEIKGETVTILALFHTARQWPPVEEG
jgi:addiction module RelE/StbE family toxin